MRLGERGGFRNLGLNLENAFTRPHEARALRYALNPAGAWLSSGRYDVGFYDRRNEGQPFVRANCASGVAFGYGYAPRDGSIDRTKPDQTVWLSGDVPCFAPGATTSTDDAEVNGIQGTPAGAVDELLPSGVAAAYPAGGSPYPPVGLAQSCLTDADINVGADGPVDSAGLTRNDATRIGDVAIYEPCAPPTPALTRLKRQVDPVCLPGAKCTFEVLLTNAGPSGWNGIPRIMTPRRWAPFF